MRECLQDIFIDSRSQLFGAEKELQEAWKKIDQSDILKMKALNGFKSLFGPTNSPWYQGTIESLGKASERAIQFAVGKKRLSSPEFLTACTEVPNVLGKRRYCLLIWE